MQEYDVERGREAAERAQGHAAVAAEQAGLAATHAIEAATHVLGVAARTAREVGEERGRAAADALGTAYGTVRERADALPVSTVLEGVLEDARDRGVEVWHRLSGQPEPKPSRWPWVAGALVGAAVAGAAVVVVRRLLGDDAPGAQEPEQLQAVVDLPPATLSVAPGGVVDEDGEAVLPLDR